MFVRIFIRYLILKKKKIEKRTKTVKKTKYYNLKFVRDSLLAKDSAMTLLAVNRRQAGERWKLQQVNYKLGPLV
jgi:hypothetical protein